MQIDWLNFTPWSALAGGALIGIAAALLINFNGRVMGASNIVGGLFRSLSDAPWRLSFLAGLIAPRSPQPPSARRGRSFSPARLR